MLSKKQDRRADGLGMLHGWSTTDGPRSQQNGLQGKEGEQDEDQMRWGDEVEEVIGVNWIQMAQNRDEWKRQQWREHLMMMTEVKFH